MKLAFDDIEEYLVDNRVGILHAVHQDREAVGAPNFFHHSAYLCNTQFLTGRTSFPRVGASSAEATRSRELAIHRAVTAYCACFYDDRALLFGSSDALGEACVQPDDFACYGEEQYNAPGFPWIPFNEMTPIRWVAAREAVTENRYYIPASLVFAPYAPDARLGEAPIAPTSVTGLACDYTLVDAIIAGIYDVITADALVSVWQGQISPPQIRAETLSDHNYDLVSRFERAGERVSLLDCTSQINVPTVMATLSGSVGKPPALVCAAAANLETEIAVTRALENLAHAWRCYRETKIQSLRNHNVISVSEVTTFRGHILFWFDKSNEPLAQFLFGSERRTEFDDMPTRAPNESSEVIATLSSCVKAAGHRMLFVPLTTEDIATCGLYVVRSIIPGFKPIIIGANMQYINGRNRSLKCLAAGPEPVSGRNVLPHPYAASGFYND
jgi:ribosomal protein S12 methylthiotransferase accessory factor